MIGARPLTPPVGGPDIQYDLHNIVPPRSITSHPYDAEDGQYFYSGHSSAHGSPALVTQELASRLPAEQYMASQYAHPYPDAHDPGHMGLGIDMGAYGAPGPAYYDDGHTLESSPYAHHGLSYNSPPTPRSTTASDSGQRTTRSGRPIVRGAASRESSVASILPAPRARRPKKAKAEKLKTPKLDAPLSVLTKGMENIPVRDMEEWVNRSVEVRKKEVEKRKGYITRPMNSFMLYRSAYAERTKQWCLQNNHQIVSSVSGESWPLEPEELRQHYNELAKVERINHQNAHPTYKFSPSKPGSAAKKRKGDDSEDHSEVSDLDDPDADWGASHGRSRNKRARIQEPTPFSPDPHTWQSPVYTPEHGIQSVHQPTWEMTSHGKPLPQAMHDSLAYNHYWQQAAHPYHQMVPAMVGDPRMRAVEVSMEQSYNLGPSLIGVPGGEHHELFQLHSHSGTPVPQEPQVDPTLLQYDHERFGDAHGDVVGDHGVDVLELGEGGAHEGLDSTLGTEYHPSKWPADAGELLGGGSEFDNLMGD